mgnify:CR=1 FL=1
MCVCINNYIKDKPNVYGLGALHPDLTDSELDSAIAFIKANNLIGINTVADRVKSTSKQATIAISVPDPIASPTSDFTSAGLSLIPSPTNASLPFSLFSFNRFSTFSTLPSGNNSV